MFRSVCRTCRNKHIYELEQKLNERILPPESVFFSKEDIDVLTKKLYSVIINHLKLLVLCESRFARKITFGGILS